MRVLYVEDDEWLAESYASAMRARGMEVKVITSANAALAFAPTDPNFDALVIDISMDRGHYGEIESSGGRMTGIRLATDLVTYYPLAAVITLTRSRDPHVKNFFERDGYAYCHKTYYDDEDDFAKFVQRCIWRVQNMLKVFIVHGHDENAALQLKNYLQNMIGLDEPTILSERASRGRTVIEKFEDEAADANVVFALFTPDDETADGQRLARQNVLFEYGYFVGRLGRGRVFLLFKKGVTLPTDLHGVIYIDISGGVETAGEKIRRELRELAPL